MADTIEKTGKTIEEALAAAGKELGCQVGELQYAVIQEPSSGFLGLFGRREAKIRASRIQKETAAAPKSLNKEKNRAEAQTASAGRGQETERISTEQSISVGGGYQSGFQPEKDKYPRRERSERHERRPRKGFHDEERTFEERQEPVTYGPVLSLDEYPSDDPMLMRAEKFLREVLAAMSLEVRLSRREGSDGTTIYEINGDRMGLLIGKHGQTLDSLQYLTNLAANRDHADGRVRIILDIEGYRSRREDTLIRLAGHLAEKACRVGQEIHLEPMSRHERKIIHMTLQDNNKVSTYSAGEEPRRYIVIVPRRRKRRKYEDN